MLNDSAMIPVTPTTPMNTSLRREYRSANIFPGFNFRDGPAITWVVKIFDGGTLAVYLDQSPKAESAFYDFARRRLSGFQAPSSSYR